MVRLLGPSGSGPRTWSATNRLTARPRSPPADAATSAGARLAMPGSMLGPSAPVAWLEDGRCRIARSVVIPEPPITSAPNVRHSRRRRATWRIFGGMPDGDLRRRSVRHDYITQPSIRALVALTPSVSVVVADDFDHQAEWVEPERGVVGRRVLRELSGLVDHLATGSTHHACISSTAERARTMKARC